MHDPSFIVYLAPALTAGLCLLASVGLLVGRRRADSLLHRIIIARRIASIEYQTELELASVPTAGCQLQLQLQLQPQLQLQAAHEVRVERSSASSLLEEALALREEALADALAGRSKAAEAGYVCARLLVACGEAQHETQHEIS